MARMASPHDDLTLLLNRAQAGDEEAARLAWTRIYGEVRVMAASMAARESQHTEPTTIVQEAFLRLAGNEKWDNRRHFFGAMRLAMQRFLVDRSRRRKARPDMGSRHRVKLDLVEGELADLEVAASDEGIELLRALEELEHEDADAAEVVRLRYIEQRTIEDTASMLGVSTGTVKNRWRAARSWLRERLAEREPGQELGHEPGHGPGPTDRPA